MNTAPAPSLTLPRCRKWQQGSEPGIPSPASIAANRRTVSFPSPVSIYANGGAVPLPSRANRPVNGRTVSFPSPVSISANGGGSGWGPNPATRPT